MLSVFGVWRVVCCVWFVVGGEGEGERESQCEIVGDSARFR